MDPSTKPGAGAPPHEWRNRDYEESAAPSPKKRRWLQITATILSLFMLLGLLVGIVQPLLN